MTELNPTIIQLDLLPNTRALFNVIQSEPSPILLESGNGAFVDQGGRYDILTSDPLSTISIEGSHLIFRDNKGKQVQQTDAAKLFTELQKALQDFSAKVKSPPDFLPFCGGFMGYVSYDYAPFLFNLQTKRANNPEPIAQFGLYDWAIVVDYKLRKTTLFSLNATRDLTEKIIKLSNKLESEQTTTKTFTLTSSFESNLTHNDYQKAFNKIHSYLYEGDCYQVNFSRQFQATYEGDAWQAYNQLSKKSPAPFSAFMRTLTGAEILSLSPERFIQVEENEVCTQPIKGTRPRSQDTKQDKKIKSELESSIKDRAENLMIVDLLRNDLSHHCTNVTVKKLFEAKSFPTVHHLESTITATLLPGHSPWQLWQDAFPGGSITGAPKYRALQIIEELEPHNRGIYCGSIGYVSINNKMDSNIAIRTLVCNENKMTCCGGGGIVIDSSCELEYQEALDKVQAYFSCLENKD